MLVLLPIPNALDYFITMCHAYASTIFLRASCHEEMHVGAVVALSPRHIITFHRIRNQQWSRRAAFAAFTMPAAGTGHVCTRPVSPGMIGTQYPSSQYDDNDTNPVSRHLPVTAARSCAQSIARQPESSFQWRSRATGLALRLLCGPSPRIPSRRPRPRPPTSPTPSHQSSDAASRSASSGASLPGALRPTRSPLSSTSSTRCHTRRSRPRPI